MCMDITFWAGFSGILAITWCAIYSWVASFWLPFIRSATATPSTSGSAVASVPSFWSSSAIVSASLRTLLPSAVSIWVVVCAYTSIPSIWIPIGCPSVSESPSAFSIGISPVPSFVATSSVCTIFSAFVSAIFLSPVGSKIPSVIAVLSLSVWTIVSVAPIEPIVPVICVISIIGAAPVSRRVVSARGSIVSTLSIPVVAISPIAFEVVSTSGGYMASQVGLMAPMGKT